MKPARPGDGGTRTILECSGVGAGGITRVLTELVRHWPAGHRIEIVAAPAGWEPPDGRAADVEILGRQTAGRGSTILAATNRLRRATGGALRDRAVQTRVLSLSPSIAVAGSRLPVTAIVHDLAFRLWPRELSTFQLRYRRMSYATTIRRSHRLLCVSARTQHDLYGVYSVPRERCRVWHPGSDVSAAADRPPEPVARLRRSGVRYFAIAGHAAHKGVELAIEALAAPTAGGPTTRDVLVVLTGGTAPDRFAALAARSGIGDRVLFLPHLSDGEYAATIAGAAAFLMPSHFEGYGLPAVEALRLGTPAIISPDPALYEAAGAGAIRMASWTAQAVCRAIADLDVPRGGGRVAGRPWRDARVAGRPWRDATGELFDLLHDRPGPAVPGGAEPDGVGESRCGSL